LIAELGAAFLCNQLELTPQTENHASYLAHWMTLLKQDNRLFLKASREASKASDYLMDEKNMVTHSTHRDSQDHCAEFA
jgi:antirestriction protein ArdC